MSKKYSIIAKIAAIMCVLSLSGGIASAATLQPTREFVVNDSAHVLSDSTRQQVIAQARKFKNTKGKPQIVLATVPTTDGQSLTDYANDLLSQKEWQIGQKGQNNGVLILYKADATEPQTRITVGRGIEDILPDATCYNILATHREDLKSTDKQRRDRGLAAVYTDVAKIVVERYGSGATKSPESSASVFGLVLLFLATLIGIPLLIVRSAVRRGRGDLSTLALGALLGSLSSGSHRNDNGWSSGSGGDYGGGDYGGFSDFGGGGDYGGGGASD